MSLEPIRPINSIKQLPMEKSDKSLPPSGFGTRPWLIQAHGSRKQTQTIIDVVHRSSHEVIVPEMQSKICLGSVYDGSWLLMLDEDTHDCFLLSFTGVRSKISLPPLRLRPASDYRGATCGVLGSPANFTVVLTSERESEGDQRFRLCCRPGDEEWTDLLAANNGRLVWPPGCSASHAGQLYAGDLIVMDYIDGAVRSKSLRTRGKVGDIYETAARHLVVSDVDIFLVLVVYLGRHHDGSLTRVLVRRLDLSRLVWTAVDSIGSDRVFLLSGDCGLSSSAAAARLQGNCIYLVWSSCDCERLYKFCLDDMTKSFHQILPEPTTPCSRAYWVVSDDIQDTLFKGQALLCAATSNEVTQPNDLDRHLEEQKGVISWPPWHDLPLELLDMIASNLALVDRIRFPAVCKPWSMVSSPIGQAQVWPWLMHISKQDGTCMMFDPLRSKQHTLQVKSLKSDNYGHTLRSSKNGWVVASAGRCKNDIFIINPFTQDIVELPRFLLETGNWYHFHGVTLSSTPTSPDNIVFGVCSSTNGMYLGMETWRHGEDLWSDQYEFEHLEDPFPIAYNSPVYFRGEFYCLGRKGNLGVFNTSDGTWRVLEKPQPIYTELQVWDDDHDGAKFCYLVDLGEDLISVFMRNADEPPRVFKLDQMKTMEWVEVKDIGGAALFVDYRASFGVMSPGAGNGNKIYFPSYSEDGKHAVFYDMETKVYHPTFYGVKEPLNCVWVVPNLSTAR